MTDPVTAPYSDKAPEYLAGSLRHVWIAAASNAAGGTGLDVTEASVTFAEDWCPHVQASVTTPMGDAYSILDPRKDTRLIIQAGYVYPGGEQDVHVLGNGYTTERTVNWRDGTMTITMDSVETRALDAHRIGGGGGVYIWAGVREILEWLISYALPGSEVVYETELPLGYRADLIQNISLAPERSIWECLEEVALRAGLWVHGDSLGRWVIAKKATVAGVSAYTITNGLTGTVREMTEALTREDWYQDVVLVYKWRDTATNTDKTIYGITRQGWPNNDPADGAGRKVFTEERVGPIDQGAAHDAAATTLRNLNTRGARYDITAHAAYWLRPGMTITVNPDGLNQTREIIQSITFKTDGFMTIKTRRPLTQGA